jgi:hypothetical protein
VALGEAAGDSAGARPAINDFVRVAWDGEDFDGQVIDTAEQLGPRGSLVFSYQVFYFDGDRRWHTWNIKDSPHVQVLTVAPQIDGVEADDWERLELRCSVSFLRLNEPARLGECRHRSCCNYNALLECGRRGAKTCPVAGCDAKFGRRHALCRDDVLSAHVASLSPHVTCLWIRGLEVRTVQPDSSIMMAVSAASGRKRPRGTEDSSSASGYTMRRRDVISVD